MSLFCGIFSLAGRPVPEAWQAALRTHLSRDGHGRIVEHTRSGAYLAKLDLGAFEAPGWQERGDGVLALCGDSLLPGRAPPHERDADLATFAASPPSQWPALLRRTRGSFALAALAQSGSGLALATDRLGVRPIYLYNSGEFLVFAGALRLIEALPGVELTADFQGTLEEAAFGISIADRTRYAGVKSLRGGSLLTVRAGSAPVIDEYWRWDRDACGTIIENIAEGLDRLYREFAESVRLRIGSSKVAFAALSGGLDSRCVVAELRSQGVDVHSLNVSWLESQDEVYGRLFSEAVGTTHHQTILPDHEVGAAVAALLYESTVKHGSLLGGGPVAKRLFGGDGGSVGIGHVYLSPPIVRLMRESGAPAAAEAFLRYNRIALARKAFRGGYGDYVATLPLQSMITELQRYSCRDPARALYVFLLENDQRRHLSSHYEVLDRYPFEFVEPLYDAEVLTIACQLPLDYCLRHHMYHEWLRTFPAPTYSIPWQSYPSHEACPIPVSDGLSSQFGRPRVALTAARRVQAKKDAWAALDSSRHLGGYLRMPALLAAYVAFRLRLSEPLYVFKQVGLFSRVINRCGGRVQIPAGALDAAG